jgi:putative oxidoreductase
LQRLYFGVFNSIMRTLLKSLPVPLLILLMVYAAASKLGDLPVFRAQLGRQPIPPEVAAVLLYLLPAAELLAVLLMLNPRTKIRGLELSLVLLLVFTGYVALAAGHWWSHVPCSCGGVLGHLPWGWHLLFNGCFLLLNAAALVWQRKEMSSG